MPDINRHYTDIKKVLRRQDLSDLFTISKYGFSPYRACEHGCLYCDGRSERYYIEGQFEKDIIIRKNLPEILDKEIGKIRERGFLCIGSGVSDPYQPVESEELIVRRCAEILLKYSIPVVVMTKSSLVLRDIDIWAELNRKSRFLLMVSLTFTDDKMRSVFEPNAGSVESRLQTIRRFKSAGCFTGVLAMPFLPLISECRENMLILASKVKETGADFLMPGGLTLRPGIQKDTFLACITRRFPELLDSYKQIYCENKASGSPSLFWHRKNGNLYKEMLEISGLPSEIPHYVYRDMVPLYEEVYLLLSQMRISFKHRRSDISRLDTAAKHYQDWVLEQKRPINRSRKRSYYELEEKLRQVCRDGTISVILGNNRLGSFISDIVLKRTIFDNLRLKLYQP